MKLKPAIISPANAVFGDGSLYSPHFGDIYHSVEGAMAESQHVFIDGNDLERRWKDASSFTIVETGFGCGLNFLLTWNALRESGERCRLDYVSVEKHPFCRDDLSRVLRQWPPLSELGESLLAAYPSLVGGFHRLHFDNGRVTLTLLFGEAEQMLSELDARADAFFLDGFAPSCNPDMWSQALFRQVARLAAAGSTVATYSVAGVVRRGLEEAGFIVKKLAGYARKREMLVANRPGARQPKPIPGKAMIVGAGIAGTSCAFAFARRGVDVVLFDRQDSIGKAASGNPAAVVRPFMTLDEGVRSRFGIAAFEYAVRLYRELCGRNGFRWNETGVLQLARDPAHLDRLIRAIESNAYPPELARLVNAQEATRLCGVCIDEQGLWFPAAGFVDGEALCKALYQLAAPKGGFRGGLEIQQVLSDNTCSVRIVDAEARTIDRGDIVILANGIGAQTFISDGASWLRTARGQVSALAPPQPLLRSPVCRDGYITPQVSGHNFVGATFDQSRADAVVDEESNRTNVLRAARILPAVFDHASVDAITGWAGVRCVSRDRLPIVGKIDQSLLCCTALGSRGFGWAPILSEALAAHFAGAPAPLERTILEHLSPIRYLPQAGSILN